MSSRRRTGPRLGREFPHLGEPAAATRSSTHRWFVTAHTAQWRRADGGYIGWPRSTAHAKQMGSLLTACGEQTQSWPKFWSLSFPARGSDVCAECWTIVTGYGEPIGRSASAPRGMTPAPRGS